MANSGLRNEDLLRRIRISGSLALKGKNERGVNVFSGSVLDDGVISGKLIRPRYNIDELQKSVDLEISELLPNQGPSVGSFVTRSLFEELQEVNTELTDEVERQSTEILSLRSKVEELHAVTQSLNVQLDGLELTNETVDRQLSTTQIQFSSSSVDLQRALQNSTQESIERVSLTARNESLQQEVDLLREQLFGRQAETQAGAQSSGQLFTVRPSPIRIPEDPPIRGSRRNPRTAPARAIRWVNGDTLIFFNSYTEDVTISSERNGDSSWIFPVSTFTLPPGERRTVSLRLNNEAERRGVTDAVGSITFTGRSEDGTTETVSLETKLVVYR